MNEPIKSRILEHLKLLQFELTEENHWKKSYSNNNCEIKVRVHNGQIDFPDGLVVHNTSTSFLKDREDFVVLECVDRLLSKGYMASNIELEKKWKLGKSESGRLDVLVRCLKSDDIYLMIECKTDRTYYSEVELMKKNGGQLFSYIQQDRTAKFLCLYASWLDKFIVNCEYCVVPISESLSRADSMVEMYNRWDKRLYVDGIFEKEVLPYEINY